MAIIGSIIGDIIGSQYEFHRPKDLDWKHCDLLTDNCHFTDDTVMTIATKEAMLTDKDFAKSYRKWGNKYPNAGYGGMFHAWLRDPNAQPYNSYGNGSAMRVSPVADYYSKDYVAKNVYMAARSAECTHNHPEGIKGATSIVRCISEIKIEKANKEKLLDAMLFYYPSSEYKYSPDKPLDSYRDSYKWDVTCQGSVPVAFRCFYESTDYESFIRNVMSLRCDMDTLCAIGGGIAEEFYGGTGLDDKAILKKYLTEELFDMVYWEG